MNEMKDGKKERGYLFRGILSVVAILAYGFINYILNPVATLGAGKIAGKQFESSDTAYVASQFGMDFFSHLGIPVFVLLAVLVWIWWKPLKALVSGSAPVAMIAFMVLLGMTTKAHAYYDKTDYAEPFFVLPNESAFFIPDVGDNKDSQAKFGSEKYLESNKIATKRFVIPHTKLENSGLFSNYYVPAGRLIIVDRTPYNREWVSSGDRGTSAKNEGFPVQSKEGINLTVGISIAVSVNEEDSPRFLYRFGVKPPAGDRTQPAIIFTSVYYSRTLTEVMDGVVKNKVQSLLGAEFTKRSFDDCSSGAEAIMTSVETKMKEYLKSVGIALDYIGWADTFAFDPDIQHAINRVYIAEKDQAVAEKLGPHTSTLKALAMADTLRAFGHKTDGKLPTTLSMWWLPTGVSDFLSKFIQPAIEATPVAPATKKQ